MALHIFIFLLLIIPVLCLLVLGVIDIMDDYDHEKLMDYFEGINLAGNLGGQVISFVILLMICHMTRPAKQDEELQNSGLLEVSLYA